MATTLIPELGALVAIVKGLLDIAKSGRDFTGSKAKATGDTVERLKDRMAGLADQLFACVMLVKTIPIWLRNCADIEVQVDTLTDEEVRRLQIALTRLISDSRYDSFSAAFYRTSFARLPGVDSSIQSFRRDLEKLGEQCEYVRPNGDIGAWRKEWPALLQNLSYLRREAVSLLQQADEVHGALIGELKQAAAAAAPK